MLRASPGGSWTVGLLLAPLVVVACGDASPQRDAGVGEPSGNPRDAGPLSPPRWLEVIDHADHAQIVALPDGGVLLVTVHELNPRPVSEVRLRAFDADGGERWSQSIEGGSFILPWEAPAVAVQSNGDIYLTLGSVADAERAAVGELFDCQVDLDVCPMRASCGNGMLEEWETCDGFLWPDDLGPHSCDEAGQSGGPIVCDHCRGLDFSACM